MYKRVASFMSLCLGAGAAFALSGVGTAGAKELVFGLMCDRTGPTQTVGVNLCPGYHDFIRLLNESGGIEGNPVKVIEIDMEYKVPQAVEAYERMKRDGAILIGIYGTPQTQALTQRLTEDKIPGTSPGFGTAAASNGEKYPYIFPIAASYWSQAAGALEYAKQQLGGSLKGKKIAYLFYDNPAGKEPMPIIEDLAQQEGFELRIFAVPPPGVEMGAQALDIARRYRADFVVAHLFGRSPSVAMKELKRVGYPLNKVVGFVWAASEADVEAAGGFEFADGYNGIQFAGVGTDYDVHKQIKAIYEKDGKDVPSAMKASVYYNRGVLIAAIHAEAVRNAIKAKGSADITGEDVKNGFEHIKGLTLGGLVPPLEITAKDHEGGGWVRIFQVRDGKFVPATEWFKAYREVIEKHLAE